MAETWDIRREDPVELITVLQRLIFLRYLRTSWPGLIRGSGGGEWWNYISSICVISQLLLLETSVDPLDLGRSENVERRRIIFHQFATWDISGASWPASDWENKGQRDHFGSAILQTYLFQLKIIFVRIAKYICLNPKIFLLSVIRGMRRWGGSEGSLGFSHWEAAADDQLDFKWKHITEDLN